MKWIGAALTSMIMGIVMAGIVQWAYPKLPSDMFAVAALFGAVLIFAIMARIVFTAASIEIHDDNLLKGNR